MEREPWRGPEAFRELSPPMTAMSRNWGPLYCRGNSQPCHIDFHKKAMMPRGGKWYPRALEDILRRGVLFTKEGRAAPIEWISVVQWMMVKPDLETV